MAPSPIGSTEYPHPLPFPQSRPDCTAHMVESAAVIPPCDHVRSAKIGWVAPHRVHRSVEETAARPTAAQLQSLDPAPAAGAWAGHGTPSAGTRGRRWR